MPIQNTEWKPWPEQKPRDTRFKRIVRYTLNPARLAWGLLIAYGLVWLNFHHNVTDTEFWETYATWPVACAVWATIVEVYRWAGGRTNLGE